MTMWVVFEVVVCKACSFARYPMISKSKAKEEFLVTETEIAGTDIES